MTNLEGCNYEATVERPTGSEALHWLLGAGCWCWVLGADAGCWVRKTPGMPRVAMAPGGS